MFSATSLTELMSELSGRRTKRGRFSPFLLRKVWDEQTSCTERWSLSCKGRAARPQRLSSARSRMEACSGKMKMKLKPNRKTCVFGCINAISEVVTEPHSPTKEHVCEHFHRGKQSKYYPVHHPFHLKGQSQGRTQSHSPSHGVVFI